MSDHEKNVTLAIGLTCLAGFTTTIGAMISFCIKKETTMALPIALAFSAGVMIYISFIEILPESSLSFLESLEHNKNKEVLSHVYSSLTFFIGILVGYCIDFLVHKIGYDDDFQQFIKTIKQKTKHNNNNKKYQTKTLGGIDENKNGNSMNKKDIYYDKVNTIGDDSNVANMSQISLNNQDAENIPMNIIKSKDDEDDNDNDNDNDNVNVNNMDNNDNNNDNNNIDNHNNYNNYQNGQKIHRASIIPLKSHSEIDVSQTTNNGKLNENENENEDDNNNNNNSDQNLIRVSIMTAIAIAVHNFPEGLITFVSTLADPKFGVTIAIAIAVHNIPEGVSVAMPIYFGTGSKWKGILWAFISGLSEPIGGLIGYAIVHNMFGKNVFGVLFGLTSGIMVYISFKGLLPTARSKDINDKYCSILVFFGFLFMDISLILFDLN